MNITFVEYDHCVCNEYKLLMNIDIKTINYNTKNLCFRCHYIKLQQFRNEINKWTFKFILNELLLIYIKKLEDIILLQSLGDIPLSFI